LSWHRNERFSSHRAINSSLPFCRSSFLNMYCLGVHQKESSMYRRFVRLFGCSRLPLWLGAATVVLAGCFDGANSDPSGSISAEFVPPSAPAPVEPIITTTYIANVPGSLSPATPPPAPATPPQSASPQDDATKLPGATITVDSDSAQQTAKVGER